MANSGLLSFRHAEMFDTRKKSLETRNEAEYKLNNITIPDE